ncbi:hypothetical protein AU099_gp91 [Gordonia phage GTE8]|uniref:Uncharacterized protein n=1 Tax=Gordonia phage GTE8 TaxID=1647475 RepID=A0A0K0N686_9CAUD|nr:hypothetical protein AU099_gp91 [Gordonia phage GTE8]AKJ72434.1 hypothetical protein GTE8_91 [Gordonia phage GTE8]
MKHQVKDLIESTERILVQADEKADEAAKQWLADHEQFYRALRDRMTQRLRKKEPITEQDFRDTVGKSDLGYGRRRAFDDLRRRPMTALRQTRPRGHLDIFYSDLVAFRDSMRGLDQEEVTDRDLTDLGFNRYGAVINRLQNPDRYWGNQVIW